MKFKRQATIRPYIADFCSFGKKLVIEVDGRQHDEDRLKDEIRTRFLENEGFIVLRFWNNEVLTNIEGVMFVIGETVGTSEAG